MRPQDDTTPEAYGVKQNHCYLFPDAAPLMRFEFNGYLCFVPLSAEEQAELQQDGLLLKDLLCLPVNAQKLRGRQAWHVHRTLFWLN